MTTGSKESCECESCKAACENKPGWFLPREAERVADFLGKSMDELFQERLGVDWWIGYEPTFVLAPALLGEPAGTEYPGNPRGKCIFYKNGRCEIHPVKPFECREYIHDEPMNERHHDVAMAWKPHQEQIKKLLGRKPSDAEFSLIDSIMDW